MKCRGLLQLFSSQLFVVLKSPFTLRKKVSKYEVFWSVFSPNTGKYGPEKTPYFDTFHAMLLDTRSKNCLVLVAKFTRHLEKSTSLLAL